MIIKRGGKYVVISEKTGRPFGTYDTLAEAERRAPTDRVLQAPTSQDGDADEVR